MRFHLIDRIDAYEPGRFIRGRKLTSRNEEFWNYTPRGRRMPEPLILESLCQACAWLVFLSTNGCQRAALLSIGSVDFQGEVCAGDVLELEGAVIAMGEEVATISGRVSVMGRSILQAEDIQCVLTEPDTLEDPNHTVRMQRSLMRGIHA